MRFNFPYHYFYLLSLTPLLLGGCVSNIVSVKGDDSSASFNTVQASIPIEDKSDEYFGIGDMGALRLKMRASSVKADFTQNIPDGKIVDFKQHTFSGPETLNGSSTIDFASLTIGSEGVNPESQVRSSIYMGVSYTDLALELETTGQQASTHDNFAGLYIDFGIYWQANPRIYAGIQVADTLHISSDVLSRLTEIELLANYQLLSSLDVMAGYRWWQFQYSTDKYDSGIELDLSGPFIGLNLHF